MKVQKQNILFMSLTVHLIPLFICLICNYFINRHLTWSLIVALSLVESFLVTWAVLSATKKVVKKVLLVISVSIIPYLAFLSMIYPRIRSMSIELGQNFRVLAQRNTSGLSRLIFAA